mmetsp:Transcript_25994/g.34800  ORF Transcript_25994/g.34800 Transcript_25994/m.34800 type:complete len:94 (+) Transcript_25994:2263-2544(+)|eukprot:CAMPEP_0185588566 /NCGR_PEP_ID=MMETSP0434-20130131/53622_1 /TAXON_ID=626734 ORGANISM="Favella taraikaensis, Strain Fe Narragansett Bay" /NCGR_SAMPLE_ID=MMETSP0434 /ASSEMBLY_ACC=CAM_ASM_000379 /LENGTH=93 /DNA_ID=CAMNT_0028211343 /DNA_START=1063 /DNA_END=1344 /DNA_ORIENTATION=+
MTDGVISRYQSKEFKMCALDVVNSVVNLAYMDPEDAKQLAFTPDHFILKRSGSAANLDKSDQEGASNGGSLGASERKSLIGHDISSPYSTSIN